MVVSVSVYSRCPRIPSEEKRLDMWRSNFRCRNHRHDGGKARHASFTSLTAFQSITWRVLKLSILTVQVSKTALFLRHGIERMGINTFFKSNTVSFETSLALQVEETSTCCLVACKIATFLPCLAAPKCHRNKAQCPRHGCHDPNPDQPQADSMGLTGLTCQQSEEKRMRTHEAQPLQAQNHDSSWSTLATLVCHKLISRLVLQLGKTCCNWSEHFCQIFVSLTLNLTCTLRCEEFESVSWSQFSGSLLMTRCWCCWTQRRWCGAGRQGLIQQVWPRRATWQIREMEPGDMVKICPKMYVKISANKDLKIQTYVKEVS